MKIKINPLFFVLVLFLIATGRAFALLWAMLALVLHETGHSLAAKARGYVLKEVVIMPYGALMSTVDRFDRVSSVIIGLGGPVVNLLTALLLLGVWWLSPAFYNYSIDFFYANMSLALFNLLPVYPLDGSRVILGFAKNKIKAVKWLKLGGVIISFIFLGLFIASAFSKINYTFGLSALFLLYGALFGANKEMYISILDSSSKNYEIGVEKKVIKISPNTPILRCYHHVSTLSETEFVVMDKDKELFQLSEAQLKELALSNKLSVEIGKAYNKHILLENNLKAENMEKL